MRRSYALGRNAALVKFALASDELFRGSAEAHKKLAPIAEREIARLREAGIPELHQTGSSATGLMLPGDVSDLDLSVPHEGDPTALREALERSGVPFRRMAGENAVHSYTTPEGTWVDVQVRPRKEVDYLRSGIERLKNLTEPERQNILLEKHKVHSSGDHDAYKKWKNDFYERYGVIPPGGDWSKVAKLVVPTKVKDSKIEGKGLFAGKDLAKGETVWKFDPRVDKKLTRKEVESSSKKRQKYLDTYASRSGDTFSLDGDAAKYLNHSESANLKTQRSGAAPMKTTRPVRKGEELTANYREFDDDAREGKLEYVKKAGELRRSHAPRTGPDRLKIKTVDGTKVRDNIDTDFTMGGNPSRYSYIPKGEMWVEKNLSPKDKASTVVHEAIEHRLMKNKGMSYDEAHDEANKSDKKVRDIYEKVKKQPLLYEKVRQR